MRDDVVGSLWLDTVDLPRESRSPLEGRQAVDVAIVGAGYTGLWTAYFLLCAEPTLRVAIVEAEYAGYGASGRNGGWCVGALAGIEGWLEDPATREAALALQRDLFATVADVGRIANEEGIACDFARGGTLTVAANAAQEQRLRDHLAHCRRLGFGPDDYRWLDEKESRDRLAMSGGRGALFSPHCAALNPLRLVRGLARAVEARGGRIYEGTRATALRTRSVATPGGELVADVVVRATEAYTARLPGERRRLLPIHSLMIATEPLSSAQWDAVGLAERETFADGRRVVIYGQRTADGRIAFGARGVYAFGGRVLDRFAEAAFRRVQAILADRLPQVGELAITHRWGGPLAVPRDWRPGLGFDRASGQAWAGGYVGEGVAASHLAGRTLADLILDRPSERTRYPWVNHRSPRWEPEPLRWLGVTAVRRSADRADRADQAGRRPRASSLADLIGRPPRS